MENIHDRLFKATLGDTQNALDFFRYYLPQKISEKLDMDSLKLQNNSFINENLKENFSDLLYTVNISKKEAFLYVLFEHKSQPDMYTGLQLLKYMTSIWEEYKQKLRTRKNQQKKLPIILPIVVYHGRGVWKYGNSLKEIVDVPKSFENFFPNFDYLFYNLPGFPEEKIQGNEILQISLRLFKYSYHPDLGEKLEKILKRFESIEDEKRQNWWFDIVLSYLILGPKQITLDRLTEIIENLDLEGAKKAMPTIAETLIQKGEQLGIAKGEQLGIAKGEQLGIAKGMRLARKEKLRTAIRMFQKGMDCGFISELTEFDRPFLERLFRKIVK